MSKIQDLKSEIAEYELILHQKGIPADEKTAALDEIKAIKKQISDLEAKEKAIEDMRAEKKKKLRKQVGGTKTKVVKKKAKRQIKSSRLNKAYGFTEPLKAKKKKKANMISVGANVKKFNKGRSKSDIIRDKQRRALPPGKRTSAAGNIYYEKRSNRGDVSKKERLEDGGDLYKEGGETEKKFKIKFEARTIGAIGVRSKYTEDVVAKNEEAAILKLYDKYDLVKLISINGKPYQYLSKGGSLKDRTPIKQPSKFAKVMREFKAGTLKSSSGETVVDKRQALAIAFSASKKEKMATA